MDVAKMAKSNRGGNMWWYKAVKGKYYTPESGNYTAYGISVYRVGLRAKRVLFMPDVSVYRTHAVKLARDCTLGQLDPAQLNDVVQDRN